MKKNVLITAGLLTLVGLLGFSSAKVANLSKVNAEKVDTTLNLDGDEIPVCTDDSIISVVQIYGNDTCNVVDEIGGITGFTGKVLAMTAASNTGVTLDFSALEISIGDMVSMEVRYYANGGALRLTQDKGSHWSLNENVPNPKKWNTKTLLADGTGFASGYSFANLGNADGDFGYFNIVTRSSVVFYIDYIKLVYMSEDEPGVFETYTYDAANLPIDDSIGALGGYLNASKTLLDAKDAPEGATDKVWKLECASGGHNVGTTLDFRKHFFVEDIYSIKFKIYVDSTNEFRIIADGSNWLTRYSLTSSANKWITVEINADGLNFQSGKSFADLVDDNGCLRPFNMCTRYGTFMYIDYLEITTYPLAYRPAIYDIAEALHMEDDVPGQCYTYYEDARSLVLGLSSDFLNEFKTLEKYEYVKDRYEAWSRALGYDPYSTANSSNLTLLENSNLLIILIVSTVAVCGGAFLCFFVRKRKTAR